MGWSIGYDNAWQRDIGYAVIAYCDHPKCNKTIDRGLAYVCGGYPYGGEYGCGLFFCSEHLIINFRGRESATQLCPKCARYDYYPYKPKQEHSKWIEWKMNHISWKEWRKENGFPEPKVYITDETFVF